jgi:hypothetical protein
MPKASAGLLSAMASFVNAFDGMPEAISNTSNVYA